MARLSHVSLPPGPPARPADPMMDLNRLLGRLQQTVLRADVEREKRLRTSEYERDKVGANIEYARALLTRMEQDALGVKILSRRQELQTDLSRKRELLEQVKERLKDLEELGATDEDESSEGEDILSEIIATPSESLDSRSVDMPTESTGTQAEDAAVLDVPPPREAPVEIPNEPAAPTQITEPDPEKLETITSQTLRPRARTRLPIPEPEQQDTAHTSGSASRSALLDSNSQTTTSLSQTATTEAILDHQRAEQDALSESILQMASSLKASSQALSLSLEEDRDVLGRAGEGLDRSERGLDAATRGMGTLRRMTEGRGWWGRILLYAWIYGLMVVLVLVVFVLPKLRL